MMLEITMNAMKRIIAQVKKPGPWDTYTGGAPHQ
jgi:hypothetical protein